MTIEITDEMVEQMKDALAELFNQRLGPEDAPYIPSDFNGLAEDELTAVLPIIEKQMRAAVEAPIRELHKPVPMVPGLDDTPVCDGCENPGRFVLYPCPTIALLEGGGE